MNYEWKKTKLIFEDKQINALLFDPEKPLLYKREDKKIMQIMNERKQNWFLKTNKNFYWKSYSFVLFVKCGIWDL